MKILSRREFLTRTGIGLSIIPALSAHAGERKLNIALCGLGRYAGYLAEGIQQSKHCRIAGIVTGTPSKAAEWKKNYNIPQGNIYNYQNFDSIASNSDIDVVYIVLPNAMHKEYVLRTAKAKKQVIVEKPMAISPTDCLEMIKACERAGVQMAVGYRLHFEPYNMEMARLGQKKVFGKVKLIESSLGYKTTDPNEWRLKKAMAGGGPLMNIGIYCVQCSRYITGEEPVSVTAQFGPVTDKTLFSEVEESVSWQLIFSDGAVATSTTTYSTQIDRVYVGAENGSFELSPAISYGPFRGRSTEGEFDFPPTNQQAVQCDEIAKVLLAGEKLPDHISGKEGLKDLKVIEAIYASAAAGGKKVVI